MARIHVAQEIHRSIIDSSFAPDQHLEEDKLLHLLVLAVIDNDPQALGIAELCADIQKRDFERNYE